MRKDVKLGFAIGGVLLAVAIVFALVNTSHPKQPVDVADGSDSAQTDSNASDSGKTDANKPAVVKNDATEIGRSAKTEQTAKVEQAKPDTAKTDIAKTDQPESRDIFGKSSTNWDESLKTGTPVPLTPVPLMAGVMETSTSDTAKNDPTTGVNTPKRTNRSTGSTVSGVNFANPQTATQTTSNGTAAPAGGNFTNHVTQRDADDLIKGAATPAGTTTVHVTAPDTRTATTHVVKNGETFVTIAAAYYGNGKYYKLIVAANPKVDPTHLKIGQTITLPAYDAKAETAKSAKPAAAPEAPIDAKAEYRVLAGDNLHRICVKLYGDSKQVDALYDLNKAKIGSDPAKLKLGMVLKLPIAPTAKSSR